MKGRAVAPAAGTILCSFATGFGSAFGIDLYGSATVELDDTGAVSGEFEGNPDMDTYLVERCVEICVERFGDGQGGHVTTDSEIPIAAGLKSSSVIANATVLATLDALDVPVTNTTVEESVPQTSKPTLVAGQEGLSETTATESVSLLEATRIGVQAAYDANVTITGAFDDATASMLGGITVTDNRSDKLLKRDEVEWDVLVWTPPEQAFSSEVNQERCERIAPLAEDVFDLVSEEEYESAMLYNGLGFCSALGFTTEPLMEALPYTKGVSLSGSGPSFVAVGDRDRLEEVKSEWEVREGTIRFTSTVAEGARIQ